MQSHTYVYPYKRYRGYRQELYPVREGAGADGGHLAWPCALPHVQKVIPTAPEDRAGPHVYPCRSSIVARGQGRKKRDSGSRLPLLAR